MLKIPKIRLSPSPHLTYENVTEIFRKHLPYEVEISSSGSKITIKKDGLIGAAIRIKHKPDHTMIDVYGHAYNIIYRILIVLFCIPALLIIDFGPARKFGNEIAHFVETCPDFRA